MITVKSGSDDKVVFAFAQSQGKRDNQEDAFGHFGAECFLIADGIGGAPDGEVAAKMAVETGVFAYSIQRKKSFYDDAPEHLLKMLMRNISRTLHVAIAKKHPGMGTTLTVLQCSRKNWWIGSIGDSRAYLLRDSQIKQITTDHCDKQGHITRWMATEKFTPADIFSGEFKSGDIMFLTSDGLLHGLTEHEITKMLQNSKPTVQSAQETAQRMVEQSLAKDGQDNITVCIIKKL